MGVLALRSETIIEIDAPIEVNKDRGPRADYLDQWDSQTESDQLSKLKDKTSQQKFKKWHQRDPKAQASDEPADTLPEVDYNRLLPSEQRKLDEQKALEKANTPTKWKKFKGFFKRKKKDKSEEEQKQEQEARKPQEDKPKKKRWWHRKKKDKSQVQTPPQEAQAPK